MNKTARGGYEYFITFTDNFSRYLMKNKAESFENIKEIHNEVQNHTGKMLKFL